MCEHCEWLLRSLLCDSIYVPVKSHPIDGWNAAHYQNPLLVRPHLIVQTNFLNKIEVKDEPKWDTTKRKGTRDRDREKESGKYVKKREVYVS